MNESTLIAVFGGVERFRALRALYAEPQRGFGQRELAAEAGIDPGSVARLLKRWTAAGVVTRRQQEGLPRYYASTDPALTPLVTLMQQDSALVHTLREFFTMIMMVDLEKATLPFDEIKRRLQAKGQEMGLRIDAQHEDVFKYMHRI